MLLQFGRRRPAPGTTFALAPTTRLTYDGLKPSGKEKAPVKASATNYNEGEDNHGVEVISPTPLQGTNNISFVYLFYG